MKVINFMIIVVLFIIGSASAEIVTLKSGKQMQGRIVEQTGDYIKIAADGKEIYFENKYIKNIEKDEPLPAENTLVIENEPSKEILPYNDNAPDEVSPLQEEIKIVDLAGFKKGLELASDGKFSAAEEELKSELQNINEAINILEGLKKGVITEEYAVYLFKAYLSLMEQNYDKAIISLLKAWQINPEDADINYNLGICYFSLKDYQKAQDYLFASLKSRPEDIQAYELLAKAYYNTGKYQQAKESLLIAKELSRKSGNYLNVTPRLKLKFTDNSQFLKDYFSSK